MIAEVCVPWQMISTVLWHAVSGAMAIGSFESTSVHVDGVLTAYVGAHSTLTCSHDNDATGITQWFLVLQ